MEDEAGELLRKLSGRTFWLRYDEDTELWYVSHKIYQDEMSATSPEEAMKQLLIRLGEL